MCKTFVLVNGADSEKKIRNETFIDECRVTYKLYSKTEKLTDNNWGLGDILGNLKYLKLKCLFFVKTFLNDYFNIIGCGCRFGGSVDLSLLAWVALAKNEKAPTFIAKQLTAAIDCST